MAGRIPQHFIDELLDRVDITEVIDRRVALKKSGRNFVACCPFHNEKTPSFTVDQEKQFYYCFGCSASGNAIGFLMDYERMEFVQAVETLADSIGLTVPKERVDHSDHYNTTQQQSLANKKRTIYTLLEQAANYYRQQLRDHATATTAVNYLKRRGLNDNIIQRFDIGYAPPGWDNLLKRLGVSEIDKQLLIDSGLLVSNDEQNKLYDRFRHRIMFPIRDNRGRIIAFGGRVLGADQPKYINSPETAVFHKNKELYGLYQARKAYRGLQRLLVVEGYMDVVALAQHDIGWSVATMGTAINTEHLKRLFRHCGEVVFCFDGDTAGKKAAERALEAVLPAIEDGRSARFLFLPTGEDPDSLVRKIGGREFQQQVDRATPLEEFLFASQSDGLDEHTMKAKAQLSKRVAPLIEQLPGGVFKELMINALAQRTGLARDQLIASWQRSWHKPRASNPASNKPHVTKRADQPRQRQPRRQPLASIRSPVLHAIGLLLYQPRAARRFFAHSIAADLVAMDTLDDPDAPLLMAMLGFLQQHPESTSAALMGHWSEELAKVLQKLPPLSDLVDDSSDLEQEFIDTLAHLKQRRHHLHIDQQIDNIPNIPFAQLSAADKSAIKDLLRKKHGN